MPEVQPRTGAGGSRRSGPRVLLVAAGMGNGHVQVARELARRLECYRAETGVVNLNDLMVAPTGDWMRRIYPWMVTSAPWLYDAVYRVFFKAPQENGERVRLPVLASTRGMDELCRSWRPDVIVSTYHLASQVIGRLADKGRLHRELKVVSFVTTFSVHDLWVHPRVDAYMCISPQAASQLRRRTNAPVMCCGPVVRPAFTSKQGARSKPGAIGWQGRAGGRERPEGRGHRALIVAGSLGMGRIEDLALTLAQTRGWSPVVVCGRNDDLRRRLQAKAGIEALGWVSDMAGLMASVDVLVDNAAGLTAKEALASGLPVVVFRPIAGHGRDDAQAMVRLGVTEVVDSFRDLVAALERAISSPAASQRAALARELFRGDAASEVLAMCRVGKAVGRPFPAAV